jgi:Skp family chaperone for outer membrane proteins
MAKKKLTAKQRKAHKRASYVRSEYFKTYDALDYLRDFTKVKDIKIPNKITMKSLKAIRKIYKEAKASISKYEGEYVNRTTGEIFEKIPTKKEMVKAVRSEPTQQFRQYRAEPQEVPQTFDPDEQYLQDLKYEIEQLNTSRQEIEGLTPLRDSAKTQANYDKNVAPRFEKAQTKLLDAIDEAIANFGAQQVAHILANNTFVERIENLKQKYTYEIEDAIESSILPLIEESVNTALEELE